MEEPTPAQYNTMMASPVSIEPKTSPMMEQYRSVKRTLPPDTILFFRLGDFYEMFFEDAVKAADILNITLTGRDGGPAGRVPMCGIPYHAFQGYVRTLLDHRLKVAICEQIGDPKASRGLLERKVTRIITPATYLDEEAKGAAPEYLTALVRDEQTYGLAYLDLSTGQFDVREIREERLVSELTLLEPREVILPASLAQRHTLEAFIKESLHASLTVYEDWIFEKDEALRRLLDAFHLASERSLPFAERPLCTRAAGTILYYLKDHLHSALEHVGIPRLLDTSDYMILDRQTQRSLELVTSLNDTKHGTLLACLDRTRTSMGQRTLHHWVTHPLLSVPQIRRRQDAVGELVGSAQTTQSLRARFEGVKDMERTLSRLNYGVANARDLLNLKIFLDRVPDIQGALQATTVPLLQELLGQLTPCPQLRDLIDSAIVENPPLTTRDGGLIKDGYAKDLDALRAIARTGRSWITEFQQREIGRTGIKSLRIKYSQVFGYAIEVSNANRHLVPEEYIRKQTLVNAERFVVPELQTRDQQIAGAQDKIKHMEYDLFNEIRQRILKDLDPLQRMAKAIGVIDVLQSLAVSATSTHWVRPDINDRQELRIEGGRHPVVEVQLPYGQFIDNDAVLDTATRQLIVLTGPNMAGKSTYIRQTALIVLMAQIGSFVPARSARIGLVDRIFTRIGASDNLAGGESTFMVEMIETAHILANATRRSLLILDEVGRGTSTFDGVSIAWAICEQLVNGSARPRTLFATHYHELTQLAGHFPRIHNANITVRETPEGIVFLRKVVPGGSDRSYGIHVARLAGIPSSVTLRANEILQILEHGSREATRIIEGMPGDGGDRPEADRVQRNDDRTHPILEELKSIHPDRLTPLEALTLLTAWQRTLHSAGEDA